MASDRNPPNTPHAPPPSKLQGPLRGFCVIKIRLLWGKKNKKAPSWASVGKLTKTQWLLVSGVNTPMEKRLRVLFTIPAAIPLNHMHWSFLNMKKGEPGKSVQRQLPRFQQVKGGVRKSTVGGGDSLHGLLYQRTLLALTYSPPASWKWNSIQMVFALIWGGS